MTKPKAKPPATSYTPRFARLHAQKNVPASTDSSAKYTGYLAVKEEKLFDNQPYTLQAVIDVALTQEEVAVELQAIRWARDVLPHEPQWRADAKNEVYQEFSLVDHPIMARDLKSYCENEEMGEQILFLAGLSFKDLPKRKVPVGMSTAGSVGSTGNMGNRSRPKM